ncbi:sensor histidine kinase [Paenibacillus sp. MMO-177]|uniref:sensor histidine kinase n=1 Tax=Paenibacillus sp. MMO-177 TaxID=3081289 RepID=UPI00301AFDB6
MFNHTRRRLAVLNAAVFLLVLVLMSSLLYVHMRQRLYHDTNEVLQQSMSRIRSFHKLEELIRSSHLDPQQDERTTYLFWDEQGRLIGQSPRLSFDEATAYALKGSEADELIRSVKSGNDRFRTLTFELSAADASSGTKSVTVVLSLNDVEGTLRSLLLDISGGMAGGVVISVLAGYFLAARALIPIRRSWDKQQRFVADASHELRTPTAVIRARTELLLRHPDHSIERESSNIAVILQETKRMGKLVDDLLTLARSDSNQLQILQSDVAIDSLLTEVAEQFRFLADTKGIEIEVQTEGPLVIPADEGRLRQLLIIVLDNALKYTPASGRIEAVCRLQSHSVYLSVSDTGCGIPEEDLPHVFERFYRGDKMRSRAQGGTGLGLSIARWIVDAHRGTIRIHSKIGAGTKVEVTLPRKG